MWFDYLCVDTVRPIVSLNRDLSASSAASNAILSYAQSPSDVNIRHPPPATPFISVLIRSAYGASPHSHVTLTTPYRRAQTRGFWARLGQYYHMVLRSRDHRGFKGGPEVLPYQYSGIAQLLEIYSPNIYRGSGSFSGQFVIF